MLPGLGKSYYKVGYCKKLCKQKIHEPNTSRLKKTNKLFPKPKVNASVTNLILGPLHKYSKIWLHITNNHFYYTATL